ncbi:thiamine-phosphate kinase [Reinekea sp. G2M2-21]|uniref:thiamine-phosphate kinase n=1 Tax=Reinekea sp. G2M2-21 TaxID=2788942 RepID=UPI0018A8DF5E|nr:thiamine-phosphate kinase [Reinekea sp. G2M2-21]
MDEFELIKRCFADWPTQHPNVLRGIGDDCLVWLDPEPLVISVDTAVIGRHFPEFANPEQVAQRAFLPAISDLAAMTATPAFFTLALTLPKHCNGDWVVRFAHRLRELAAQYNIMLAGGDTTLGEQLTVTINVHGRCPHPVLRNGAQAQDDVWVTGYLGQAAAALPYVLANDEKEVPMEWWQAYWQPDVPLEFAIALQGCIHSAIDISDGLVGDALHIAQQSELALHLNVHDLPLDSDLKAAGENGLRCATSGGDDYQLLFTAAPMVREEIQHLANQQGVLVTRIGQTREGKPAVHWYDGDRPVTLPWQSFTHFNKES